MHHRLGLSSDDGAALGFGSLGGTNQASLNGTLAYDTFHDVNGVALRSPDKTSFLHELA